MKRKVLNTTLRRLPAIALACGAICLAAQPAFATFQDDEIVLIDENGDEVDARNLHALIQLEADAARADGQQQEDLQIDGAVVEQNVLMGNVVAGSSVRIDNDRIIITEPDGTNREIDISGARSVSVNRSVKSVSENGEQAMIRTGKAIIIDANGERYEIPLGDVEMAGDDALEIQGLAFDGMPDELRIIAGEGIGGLRIMGGPGQWSAFAGDAGKFVIGVVCEPVSDQLRAHLDLDPGVGLVVTSVNEDGAAGKAGVKQHDVLVFADDKQLTSREDLSAIIERAGEDEQSISITAQRNGKEISFEVTPAENTGGLEGFRFNGMPGEFRFQQIGPGIIVEDSDFDSEFAEDSDFDGMRSEEFQQEMHEMRQQHQQLMEQHRKMMEEFQQRVGDGG